MIAQAPEGVEVVRFRLPSDLPDLSQFDRVVVGSTERLSNRNVDDLIPHKPVVWVRSSQPRSMMVLFRAARLIMWPSHECARWHDWFDLPYEISPAPLDVTKIPRDVPKEDFALWAGRSVGHKNEAGARAWAEERGINFVAITNADRDAVLEAMGRARWFVHLPVGLIDPCPRTVIEAEIAGCEIVANDLVGRTPVRGAEANAAYIDKSAERFWGFVLNGR
jgi:hypothetical protein